MKNTSFLQRKFLRGTLLFLSELGALALFSAPSTIITLMLLAVLALTLFTGLVNWKEPVKKFQFHFSTLLLTLGFGAAGFLIFPENMAYFHPMTRLAETLSIPYLVNARILAGAFVLLGFYAFYRLAAWMEENLCRVLNLPMCREDAFPLSNLIFPLSALGFFLLEPDFSPVLTASLTVGTAFALIIALHGPEFLSFTQTVRGTRRVLAAFTALGIAMFRTRQADLGVFGFAAGVLSLPFLYLCLVAFYGWLDRTFASLHTFQGIEKQEKVFYLCLFLAAALFAAVVFFRTDAFYGTPYAFDVIYTADSPKLVKENAFLALRHQENDLRQPVFAVFAAPFAGLPYLLSRFLPLSSVVHPLLLDFSQIGLLLLTNFLLARILDLDTKGRMLFMALTSVSYPVLLFLLMMEQYIVVYFYLILCIYLILNKKEQAELSLAAAGGTLLTSLILAPFLGTHHPVKEFKSWYQEMLRLMLTFLCLILFFGRLDILLNAPSQILLMLQFSGQELTVFQKLTQYSGFFSQCLLAPAAGVDLTAMGHASWQMLIPTGFSVLGLTVLALSLISFLVNRKDPACKAAFLWLIFSFAILFLLGWGTKENGLVLYTLYFGWAVWVLLMKLFQHLHERIPHFLPIAGILTLLIFLAVNLPALWQLLSFAFSYYPI